jgi:hypothetical protein
MSLYTLYSTNVRFASRKGYEADGLLSDGLLMAIAVCARTPQTFRVWSPPSSLDVFVYRPEFHSVL